MAVAAAVAVVAAEAAPVGGVVVVVVVDDDGVGVRGIVFKRRRRWGPFTGGRFGDDEPPNATATPYQRNGVALSNEAHGGTMSAALDPVQTSPRLFAPFPSPIPPQT